MSRWPTLEELKSSKVAKRNPQLFDSAKLRSPQKRSKFGNTAVEVDGERIHSKGEARRYKELRFLLKKGKIGFLARQVQFELNPNGTHSLIYLADFYYQNMETGEKFVEDFKRYATQEFKKKQRLMKKIYGIEIKIT